MLKFINDILVSFRECFSRKATFCWFVVIVCGIIVATDHMGVTSIVRGLSLASEHYVNLIGFFRSGGWNLESLFSTWCKIVEQTARITSWGAAGTEERQDSHVVETIKLAYRASTRFCSNAILLLDAYYLSVPALEKLEELNSSGKILHIVTRGKSNCRAYEIPEPNRRYSVIWETVYN